MPKYNPLVHGPHDYQKLKPGDWVVHDLCLFTVVDVSDGIPEIADEHYTTRIGGSYKNLRLLTPRSLRIFFEFKKLYENFNEEAPDLASLAKPALSKMCIQTIDGDPRGERIRLDSAKAYIRAARVAKQTLDKVLKEA